MNLQTAFEIKTAQRLLAKRIESEVQPMVA
jgi:hypothetical protein